MPNSQKTEPPTNDKNNNPYLALISLIRFYLPPPPYLWWFPLLVADESPALKLYLFLLREIAFP